MTEATGNASTPALGMEPEGRNETQNPQPKDSKTEVSTDLTARREAERIVCAAILKFGRDPHAASAPIAEAAATEILSLLPSPTAQGEPDRERLAQWLCEEVDWPEPYDGRSWPLHDNDSGHRGGGGFVKLQPIDIVERFREIANRMPLYATPQADVTRLVDVTDAMIRGATLVMMDREIADETDPDDYFARRHRERTERLRSNPEDPEWAKGYEITRAFLEALASQRNGAGV